MKVRYKTRISQRILKRIAKAVGGKNQESKVKRQWIRVSNIAENLFKMRTGTFTFHLCYRDAGGVEDRGARLVCDKEGILICFLFSNNSSNIVMIF